MTEIVSRIFAREASPEAKQALDDMREDLLALNGMTPPSLPEGYLPEDCPEIVREVWVQVNDRWWRCGPAGFPHIIHLHPIDFRAFAAWYGCPQVYFFEHESDFGTFGFRGNKTVERGTVRFAEGIA